MVQKKPEKQHDVREEHWVGKTAHVIEDLTKVTFDTDANRLCVQSEHGELCFGITDKATSPSFKTYISDERPLFKQERGEHVFISLPSPKRGEGTKPVAVKISKSDISIINQVAELASKHKNVRHFEMNF